MEETAEVQGRMLLSQSEVGIQLVNGMVAYFCITTFLTVVWVCVLWYRVHRHSPGHKHGLFTVGNWHWVAQAVVCFLVVNFVVVPNLTMAVSFVLGPILAVMEGWPWRLGIEYVISNVLGMQDPLTSVVPTRNVSRMVDIAMCIWAMLLCATVMALSSQLSFIMVLTDAMPESTSGLLRYLFVFVPLILIILSVFTGGVMALIEEWSFFDGFIFMCGASSGLSNPLISQTPETALGSAFECLCLAVELCLGGAIVGIVGAHPAIQKVSDLINGSQEDQSSMEPSTQDLEQTAEVSRLRNENLQLREELERLKAKRATTAAIDVSDVQGSPCIHKPVVRHAATDNERRREWPTSLKVEDVPDGKPFVDSPGVDVEADVVCSCGGCSRQDGFLTQLLFCGPVDLRGRDNNCAL